MENRSVAIQDIPFKAVIFDMDGTLIASTEADYLAWKRLFEDYGEVLTFERYFPLLGRKSIDVVQSQLHLHGDAADHALSKKLVYFEEIVSTKGIEKIPYAEQFLKSLSDYPVQVALATSSRRMKTELVLKKLGLKPFFHQIVTGEEVSNGKPFPDIFLKAAAKLNVRPEDCLVFEDAASGVAAAKNAGMKCIAITTTHSIEELQKADLIIDSFESADFISLCKKIS